MIASENESTEKVVALRPKRAARASERKWGIPVMTLGFCIVPSLLLRAQSRLGLNPTQLAVLLQLCDFWWDEDRKPFPSKQTLADRLGLSPRQIQRYIKDLEDAGLVKRIERHGAHGGLQTNIYDLSGLVKRLQELEPEFRDEKEAHRNRLAALSRCNSKRKEAG